LEQDDDQCVDHLATADRTDSLARLGLDTDSIAIEPKQLGEARTNGQPIRRELDLLQVDRGIDIDDLPSLALDTLECRCNEAHRVSTSPCRIGVREQLTDIAFGKRSKQRIRQRMQHDVTIGVRNRPDGSMAQLDTTQHETTSWFEAVAIGA
jgi:hypothetical protein